MASRSIGHRLIFVLRLPPGPTQQAAIIRDALDPIHPVSDNRLHMTLGITGDYDGFPSSLADAATLLGGGVHAAPVAIALDCLSVSPSSIALRPSRIPTTLRALCEAVGGPLRRRGMMRAGWAARPHVTLGYRTGLPDSRPVVPIAWTATEFVLIHSVVGRTRHVELGRWPLTSAQLSLPLG